MIDSRAGVVIFTFLGSSTALIVSQSETPQRLAEERPAVAPTSDPTERFLAWCAILGSESELALAEIAAERASLESVRSYAEGVAQAHRSTIARIRQAVELPRPTLYWERPGWETEPLSRLSAILEEVARRSLAAARRELAQKSGLELDRGYLSGQVLAHAIAAEAIPVLGNHVAGSFQQALSEALPQVEQRLDRARTLVRQLDASLEIPDPPASCPRSQEGR